MSMNEVHDMNIWKSNKTQHVAEWSADNNRKTRWRTIEIVGDSQFYQSL